MDMKANCASHKAVLQKVYHRRSGIVLNVTERAVGVLFDTQVGVHPHLHWCQG